MNQKETDIVQELQAETQRSEHLYTLERPVWGYRSMTMGALREHRNALTEWNATSREAGGFLAVSFAEAQEQDAITLLLLTLSGLKAKGEPARLVYPLTHPFIVASDFPLGCLLIHQATRISGVLEVLKQAPAWWRGRVVIATGPMDEWERLSCYPSIHMHPLPISTPLGLTEAVNAERDLFVRHSAAAKAYTLVAAFDAFGVALPLSLLARALELDEDQAGLLVEQSKGLLYWIERERPAGLLVSTKGELIARRTMEALYGRQAEILLQESQQQVLQVVDLRDGEERHVAIRLFQTLVAQGKRPWARRLAEPLNLDLILAQAAAPELLAWGTIYTRLELPELAARVFQEALAKGVDSAHFGYTISEPVLGEAGSDIPSAGISLPLGHVLDLVFRSWSRLTAPSIPIAEGMAAASEREFALSSEAWREGELEVRAAADRRDHLVIMCEKEGEPCQDVEVALVEVGPDGGQRIMVSERTNSQGRADLGGLDRIAQPTRVGQYLLRVTLPET